MTSYKMPLHIVRCGTFLWEITHPFMFNVPPIALSVCTMMIDILHVKCFGERLTTLDR